MEKNLNISIYLYPSPGAQGKESSCQAGDSGDTRDTGLMPGLGRSLGEGHGNPLQYSCQENPRQRSLADCSPRGHKVLDTTEQLSMRVRACVRAHTHTHAHTHIFESLETNTTL